jgi:hypothetical protein
MLGGALDVDLWNGYAPAAGAEFDLIHADSGITGTFANLDLPTLMAGFHWEWQYGTNDFWLRVARDGGNEPVPEPTTYALMGLGLAALAIFRKKLNK